MYAAILEGRLRPSGALAGVPRVPEPRAADCDSCTKLGNVHELAGIDQPGKH
jgi:hypothetical protein